MNNLSLPERLRVWANFYRGNTNFIDTIEEAAAHIEILEWMLGLSPHRPAAFINAIEEEGTKQEAIEWLHTTWDELQDALALIKELQADNKALTAKIKKLEEDVLGL